MSARQSAHSAGSAQRLTLSTRPRAVSGRRLYVGRIPQQATRADFEQHFGAVGRLVDIRIMAGFAFLEYESLRVRRRRLLRVPIPRPPC